MPTNRGASRRLQELKSSSSPAALGRPAANDTATPAPADDVAIEAWEFVTVDGLPITVDLDSIVGVGLHFHNPAGETAAPIKCAVLLLAGGHTLPVIATYEEARALWLGLDVPAPATIEATREKGTSNGTTSRS